MAKKRVKHLPAQEKKLLKLDLACGQRKQEGFTGVDLHKVPGVDIACDLLKFPWPFDNETVEEIYCAHFFEHVPGKLRGKFMDEVHRILVPGGKMAIICPYWTSERAIQDFTHEWPPISESSFLYFNQEWRKINQIDHYLCNCDFDFTYGYAMDQETASRSEEVRNFWVKRHLRTVQDIHVNLTKRSKQ